MSELLGGILSSGGIAAARQVATFAEARQAVLADNVANIDTPFYKARDLPVEQFQEMLGRALAESRRTGAPVRFEPTRDIEVGTDGRPQFKPIEREDNNILFHDRGNRSIETEMSEMVKNAMLHRVAVEVLRKQNETLEAAIRGRI